MRIGLMATLTLLLAIPAAVAFPLSDPAAPWVTAGAPGVAPTLDGVIDAREWAGSVPLTGFGGVNTQELSSIQPTVRVARDAAHLYLAVHVPLPGGRAPVAKARQHDGAVWEDDSVEVFLDPGHGHQEYFQFTGNAIGTRLDARGKDAAWNGEWQFQARAGKGSWSAELAIPFATLQMRAPGENAVWGFNVCASIRGVGSISWAPVLRSFHEPARFGHLRFSSAGAAGIETLAGLLQGGGEIKGVARGTGVSLRWQLSRDGAQAIEKRLSGSGEFAFPVELPRDGRFPAAGRYTLEIVAERAGDKLPLMRLAADHTVSPPLQLRARAFVYAGRLETEAAVEAAGLNPADLACRFALAPEGGKPSVTREAALENGRTARATFQKAEVPEGKITVSVTLLEKGMPIRVASKVLDRPLSPPWLGDRTGITDEVPAPWTPLKVRGKEARAGARGSAVSVRPWGRDYRFEGGLFPAQVTAKGASVLAGPITLRAARAGQALPWREAWTKVSKNAPSAVDLAGGAVTTGARLSGTARVEFDGMLRVDLELSPEGGAAPDMLVLEVPLRAEHARYLYHFPGQWGSVENSGALPAEGWHHAFKPFVWLGDEERGFSWFCESEENWSPADPERAITIDREGDRVVLRLHLVEGAPVQKPLKYTFGFQATPVKQPEKDAWDYRIHHGGSYTLHKDLYTRQGRVAYPAAGLIRGEQGTFEAWVQPLFDSDPSLPAEKKRGWGNRGIFSVRLPDDTNFGIYWNELVQGPVVWVRENGNVTFYAGAPIACKSGEWHHLAFTWGDAIRCYYDGECVFERPRRGLTATPLELENTEIVLGERLPHFVIDEVRILDVARAPVVPAGPLEADAHTLFLERFERLGEANTFQPEKGPAGKLHGGATLVEGRFGKGLAMSTRGMAGYTKLDRLAEMGVRTVCFHEHWTPWQSHPYTTPENEPKLAELVKAIHAKKMQLLLYMGRKIADIAPEYELYSEDVLMMPRGRRYTRQPPQTDWGICWRSHWKEFALKGLAETMDRFGSDGWYLDGSEWPCPCTNRDHGCGYVKPDGTIGPTHDIFATREFMRRLYVLTRQRRPDGQLNIHNSTVMVIPTLAWGTSTWNGEQLGSIDRGPEFLKLMPLDAFRTEMMGHPFGVPSEFLCYERPWTTHEALSFTLLHDVLVRPNGYDDRLEEVASLWRAMDAFGRNKARWLPYWKNSDLVRPEHEAVKVSLYTRGKDGTLLVVSNLSAEARTAKVELNLKQLGLRAGAKAVDARTNEPVTLENGRLAVELGGFDYTLVHVR
jgi:hypothetical protein